MTDKHETLITKRPLTNTGMEPSELRSTEGLTMFDGSNLTPISDEDQDKQMLGLHECYPTY